MRRRPASAKRIGPGPNGYQVVLGASGARPNVSAALSSFTRGPGVKRSGAFLPLIYGIAGTLLAAELARSGRAAFVHEPLEGLAGRLLCLTGHAGKVGAFGERLNPVKIVQNLDQPQPWRPLGSLSNTSPISRAAIRQCDGPSLPVRCS